MLLSQRSLAELVSPSTTNNFMLISSCSILKKYFPSNELLLSSPSSLFSSHDNNNQIRIMKVSLQTYLNMLGTIACRMRNQKPESRVSFDGETIRTAYVTLYGRCGVCVQYLKPSTPGLSCGLSLKFKVQRANAESSRKITPVTFSTHETKPLLTLH